jgi:transposase InsO family protein
LPPSNNFDSIMIVVDHGLSKGVIYIPCTKTIDALGAAQLSVDHVWKRFGLPDVIISNRGPQFASKVSQEVCKQLCINHHMSTAYHLQTDGEME